MTAVEFLEGPVNVEDLARVPGTDWLIGSGMASPGVPDGRLHVIHAHDGTWWALTPADIPVRPVALRAGEDGIHCGATRSRSCPAAAWWRRTSST